MDIQLGRSKTVRRAYGIDEIALVPGGRTVDPEVTDTSWSLGGVQREIPIIASAMDGARPTSAAGRAAAEVGRTPRTASRRQNLGDGYTLKQRTAWGLHRRPPNPV